MKSATNPMPATYEEVLDYLYKQLPMYQRIGQAAYKADLETTLALDAHFGHPHQNFKSIHIAGTNGKGSVSHIIASVLQSSGYKIGLYTSPHLKDYRERIRINGQMIEKEYVKQFVINNFDFFGQTKPSFFEMSVALAFQYFSDKQVDVAVVEVGMGGRLDSTNIITPLLSIITNISYDHTQFLGNTLPLIAAEKAGIIKPGTPVVVGESHPETKPVFTRIANQQKAPICFAEEIYVVNYALQTLQNTQNISLTNRETKLQTEYELPLNGQIQQKNLMTCMTALQKLQRQLPKICPESILDGLKNTVKQTNLQGRWQTLGANPRIIADTGHNEAGIEQIASQIHNTPHKDLHLILGFVNDKNVEKLLGYFPENAQYYYTQPTIPRAMPLEKLDQIAQKCQRKGQLHSHPAQALAAAKQAAHPADFIFIGGSTFVVADIL